MNVNLCRLTGMLDFLTADYPNIKLIFYVFYRISGKLQDVVPTVLLYLLYRLPNALEVDRKLKV